MRLFKKASLILILSFVMMACVHKQYNFKVTNDLVIVDQSEKDFSLEMLENYVTLFYGEQTVDLDKVDIEGTVDLSKIDNYDITLKIVDNKSEAFADLTISVVDRKAPKFYIFENELLVHIDENLEINSKNFFINLDDGLNGLINERISVDQKYDLSKRETYNITLIGKDESGNQVTQDISLRVTDLIDEKAQYLYKKARILAFGEAFVYKNDDVNEEIVNFEDALAVFTPNYRNHFLWISGVTGLYNPIQSGVKIKYDQGKYYADLSEHKLLSGYKNTKLDLKYEDENLRIYAAQSTYQIDGKDEVKVAKFAIKKIEGVWLVDEFYLQYD